MPDLASALKQEIARIARKEIRAQIETSQASLKTARRQIGEMKRRVQTLERQLYHVTKGVQSAQPTDDEVEEGVSLRFRAEGFAKHRQRLGLSAKDVGVLVGASALSVYKWEQGKARPREKHLQAIATLRSLGKREAARLLAERST